VQGRALTYWRPPAGPIVLNVQRPVSPRARSARRLVAAAAAVLAALAIVRADAPQIPEPAGSITGTVRLAGASSRRLATPGAYPGRRISAVSERDVSELQNVVVYVRLPRAASVAPVRAVVRQTDEEFVPHVVAVVRGSTVEFPNDDLVFHNVFSLSRAATFDLGRYPKGETKSVTFAAPGIVKVYCHLHSHMSAVVRMFDHPHFTVVGADGRFALAGLAPGSYEVAAWHERAGEASTSVRVTADDESAVSFSLPLRDQ